MYMDTPDCRANTHEMVVRPAVKVLLTPWKPLKKLSSMIIESISVITSSVIFISQITPLNNQSPKEKGCGF